MVKNERRLKELLARVRSARGRRESQPHAPPLLLAKIECEDELASFLLAEAASETELESATAPADVAALLERVRLGRARAEARACNCRACSEDPDYEDARDELLDKLLEVQP